MAEARQLQPMPLRLRRASDQYPHAGWEPSDECLVVLSGETVVGSLQTQTLKTEAVGLCRGWRWSITSVLIDPDESPRIGWTASREEARQRLAKAWRAWLARTGLKEIS